MASEKYNLALEQCLQSIEINPAHRYSHICAVESALKLGLKHTAHKHMLSYMKLVKAEKSTIELIKQQLDQNNIQSFYHWRLEYHQKHGGSHFLIAMLYAQLEDNDQALKLLEKAIQNHHVMIPTAWGFSEFRKLRQDNRFTKLMKKVIL